MAKIRREDGFHCACPGNPPTVPPYMLAVPTGGCEGACQGGVRTPDNSVTEISSKRRTAFSNMSGMGKNGSMSVGAYAISMLSVGVLFFVIGYGYFKGKESA